MPPPTEDPQERQHNIPIDKYFETTGLWQPLSAQVVSPGAPVFCTGGLVGSSRLLESENQMASNKAVTVKSLDCIKIKNNGLCL